MKINRYFVVLIIGMSILTLPSCKRQNQFIEPEEVDRINPYDSIDYGSRPQEIPVDSASFLGIHKYIFATTCAVPACHDGSFEPDFRTVESAYSSLVLQKPLKNNATNSFDYRVEPGHSEKSWLYERIITDDPVLGRMPLYDNPLTPRETKLISDWIDAGAPDIFTNSPSQPDPEPAFFGILAYLNDTSGIRLDTTRQTAISAMIFPQNAVVDIWFGLFDSNEEEPYIPASNFTYNKFKLSSRMFDFANVTEQTLLVLPSESPYFLPIPNDATQKAPYYHHMVINTADYPKGQAQYMRIYVQDEDHALPTELPDDGTQFYLLTYFSFIVQ